MALVSHCELCPEVEKKPATRCLVARNFPDGLWVCTVHGRDKSGATIPEDWRTWDATYWSARIAHRQPARQEAA